MGGISLVGEYFRDNNNLNIIECLIKIVFLNNLSGYYRFVIDGRGGSRIFQGGALLKI